PLLTTNEDNNDNPRTPTSQYKDIFTVSLSSQPSLTTNKHKNIIPTSQYEGVFIINACHGPH
ncbi:24422_t:CDS:2, partial [Gigaspora rosea]